MAFSSVSMAETSLLIARKLFSLSGRSSLSGILSASRLNITPCNALQDMRRDAGPFVSLLEQLVKKDGERRKYHCDE